MAFFTDETYQVFLSLADGLLGVPDAAEISSHLADNRHGVTVHDAQNLIPSKMPGFRAAAERIIGPAPEDAKLTLSRVLNALRYRPVAGLLANSLVPVDRLSPKDTNDLFWLWYKSPIGLKRKLFRSLSVAITVSYIIADPLIPKMCQHPEYANKIPTTASIMPDESFFRYKIVDLGPFTKTAEIEVDVVIVGSGSGAGVVASELSRKGHRVLVIEKGKYFHQTELNFNEIDGFESLYEASGLMTTEDGAMTVLAGATLGGGSTVNWSASLEINPVVKKEWARSIPWIESDTMNDAYRFVSDSMGISTEHIHHSKANQMLLDGAKKLGWAHKEVPQNTGHQVHDCGFCHYGCRAGIKQGGVVYWLRDAVEHGAQVIDETIVKRIVRNPVNGEAAGVSCLVKSEVELLVRAKRVVVSAGSLQTPGVLQRSGFRNGHIGRHLKLHPSIIPSAIMEEDLDPLSKPILTSVVTEFNNLDQHGHGPLLEVTFHSPILSLVTHAWRPGAACIQKKLANYRHNASFLVITRDRGSGRVFYTKENPYQVRVDYTPSKYDCQALHKGLIEISKIIYLEGAKLIDVPHSLVPQFESTVPKERRTLKDPEFVKWMKILKGVSLEIYRTPFGTAHQMGTCRMGTDPSNSAVDSTGRLWECSNVFVADTSVFPEASGANPMLTCMALAKVIAGNIDESLAPKGKL